MNGRKRSDARGRVVWTIFWIVAAGLLFFAAWSWDAREILRTALARIDGLGPIGPAVFIALYVIATVLFVPGSVLTLGAGAIFGVVAGSVYVSLAATAGATSAFLIGRYLARDWVARRIEKNPRFRAIDEAVAGEGWKIVGLVRLSPVFPFNLVNYAFGLTRVPLNEYVLATWLGMIPGTVLYVFLGSIGGDLVAGRSRTPLEGWLYAAGLVATAMVTVLVTRIARKALQRRIS